MAALRSALFSRVVARAVSGTPSPLSVAAVSSMNKRTFLTSSVNFQVDPKAVWKLGRLNHVAIAVPDLKAASAMYRDILGAKVSDAHEQPEHGVYTVFVELGNTKIELLHPLGNNSPIQGFLDKNKSGGLHHICIEVDDINAAVKAVTSMKIRALGKEPKIGAHGKPVMFLHPKDCSGVLIELEQS